jgi:hypothetical protein
LHLQRTLEGKKGLKMRSTHSTFCFSSIVLFSFFLTLFLFERVFISGVCEAMGLFVVFCGKEKQIFNVAGGGTWSGE